ncbi:MAG: hypothetical protein KIS92_21185 [Planctomycetota bacterium]|nr:hypothetical protein [Planctomycetota bacterium]
MTFYQWIIKQKGDSRIDSSFHIVDVATSVRADDCFPKNAASFDEIRTHIQGHGAIDECLECLEYAFAEYLLDEVLGLKPDPKITAKLTIELLEVLKRKRPEQD